MTETRDNLRIERPDGFAEHVHPTRIVLVQEGDLRTPLQISVWLADRPPTLSNPQPRRVGEHDAHYTIDEQDGGSGGSVFTLHAFAETSSAVLVLQAEVQAELAPDFAAAWATLASATVEP